MWWWLNVMHPRRQLRLPRQRDRARARPDGSCWHAHVEGPFDFLASAVPIDVKDHGAFLAFAYHDRHQNHLAVAVDDASPNPAIHEIDHEGWYRVFRRLRR